MNEEEKTAPEITTAQEYVDAVKKLKETTVDRALYEKQVNDNKVLREAILEGRTLDGSDQQEQNKPDAKALTEKLLKSGDNEISNAEYVKTALELREAAIAEGQIDPFLPAGQKIQPTVEDIAKATRVAEGLQYCLDEATDEETGEIDDDIFNAMLKKIIAEDSPALAMRLAANNGPRKMKGRKK